MTCYSSSLISEVVIILHIVTTFIRFVLHIKVVCCFSPGRDDECFILKIFTSHLTYCLWNMSLDISVTAQTKQKCVILLENSILQYRKTKYNIHHIYFTFHISCRVSCRCFGHLSRIQAM